MGLEKQWIICHSHTHTHTHTHTYIHTHTKKKGEKGGVGTRRKGGKKRYYLIKM